MNSDSDSDCSHISATPPRPSRPPPAPKRALLLSKSKSKSKPKSKIKTSSPKNHCQAQIPQNHTPPQHESTSTPSVLSSLPYQIHRSSIQLRSNAIGTISAGSLARRASFVKFQRESISFEDDQVSRSGGLNARELGEDKCEELGIGCSWKAGGFRGLGEGAGSAGGESSNGGLNGVGSFQGFSEGGSGVLGNGGLRRGVRRSINLVGDNVALPTVKVKRGSGEGNFVKLNMGKNKRKFLNKGKRKSACGSSRRTWYKRSKKEVKGDVDGEMKGVYDEDGLVTEIGERMGVEGGEGDKFYCSSIKEAVMEVRGECSDENLERLLKLVYGYDFFRDGQLEAIKMVIEGKSTMLVLPTGAGKSLCYQIPAMILPGITLVVSPLVALMIDQLKHLPPVIHGGLLCSSQMPEEVSDTLRRLHEGIIKVLFVSPERLLNADFLSIFSGNLSISLVAVDEAHCISEWSHNFRPAYMRLRASLLRNKLNAKCILAMTATATKATLHDVMDALEILPTNLVQKAQLRDNLQLSVSLSGNRTKDLLSLIKSSPFKDVKSIIVYCKFQAETDILSKYLRDNNISAKSYHSNILAKERRRIQDLFCSNKIRVVVATVAFGMGLDKSDVGAVIHYSLPESLEEYVQEIGRAGRDGRLSYCHLFFDDVTYFKLRSLSYSDGVDEYAVNRLLSHIFTNDANLQGKICSVIKETAARKYDMKEEVMLTILTRLELGEVQYLRLLPQLNVTCCLNFHESSPAVLAEKDVVVAAIVKRSEARQGQYVFDIPDVANSMGITATDVSNQLQRLKLKGEVTYELKDPAYCYAIVKVPDDVCSLAAELTKWLSEVESCKVQKLDAMFNAAVFTVNTCEKMHGCNDIQHTPCLQKKISDYFTGDKNPDISNRMGKSSPFLRADIKVFLQSNSHAKFTPRAVARIMHGIGSPAYPSMTWSKSHFWGRYAQIDFRVIMEAAQAELMNIVGKVVQ